MRDELTDSGDGRQASATRDRLLGMAAASKNVRDLGARRRSVLGILRASLPSPADPRGVDLREAEVFETAYGDAGGRAYWSAWLASAESDDALARLLAAHLTAEECERGFAEASDALSSFGVTRDKCLAVISAVTGATAADKAAAMLANPNTGHLLPWSLREYLSPAPEVGAPEMTQPKAQEAALPEPAKLGRKRGRKKKFDRGTIRFVIQQGCVHYGGKPRDDRPDEEWRGTADVMRLVREKMARDWSDDGPSDSTLRDIVDQILSEMTEP